METSEELASNEIVLSVQGVSKKFCRSLKRSLFYGINDITAEVLGIRQDVQHLRQEEFWALKDVCLELRRGEALGLVGVNGSGKTTLLRIISGLIRPDAGLVKHKGRLAPLIALGAGFNPILTGRENIYVNMSILGLSQQEIDARFDVVAEFAEIGDAIDAPVQTYSSGMAARLGFACAIHTEPDILLIDEVLAVGDAKFRGKCFRKLNELRNQGVAFILVSHNANQILTICQTSVYLRKGEMLAFGDTSDIINRYEEDLFLDKDMLQSSGENIFTKPSDKSSGLDITDIFFRDEAYSKIKEPISGNLTYVCIRCQVYQTLADVYFTININGMAEAGGIVLNLNSYRDQQPLNLSIGQQEVQIELTYLGLKLGAYTLNIYAHQGPIHNLDTVESFPFTVRAKESMSRCLFYQPRVWKLSSHHESKS